jgi:putative membrane protein
MKWGVAIALVAGLVAAAWLFWVVRFGAVVGAIATAGISGVALLCAYALLVFIALALAWYFLLPPAHRRPLLDFYVARVVRDSIAEISPFSPVGGMVAAARLMILKGMNSGYAAASVAADATTEAMAQVAFLAFGLGWGVTQFSNIKGGGELTRWMIAVLLLAGPAIALLIFLLRRGAGFAERLAGRFFPQMKGASIRDAMEALYDSKTRLTLSALWHLVAWFGGGVGTFIAFRLIGANISLLNAVALEALLSTLRSIAAPVPAAIGVQEWSYALLARLFGLPEEMGVAVSLLKRAREIVVGVPALVYWQVVEGRKALVSDV